MLVSIPIDHFRTARHDVPDHAPTCFARKALDDGRRKAVGESRKRSIEMKSGDFPVPGGAVLAGRRGSHRAPRTGCVTSSLNANQILDVAESESLEPGKFQSATDSREIPECVAPRVAIGIGVRSGADSHSVENDYRRALHAGAST